MNGFTIFVDFLQILLESWLIGIRRLSSLSFRWLLPLCWHLSDVNICVQSRLDDAQTYHVGIMLAVSLESFFSFEVILFEIGHVHCRPAGCENCISLLSKIQLVCIGAACIWPRNRGGVPNWAHGILVSILLGFPDVYRSCRRQPYFFPFLELLLVALTGIHFVILRINVTTLAEQVAPSIHQRLLYEIRKLSVNGSSFLKPNVLVILNILLVLKLFLVFIWNELSVFYAKE